MLRKIKTQAEIDRKRKRTQVLVGGVLILLLIVSTAGYSLISGDGGGDSKVSEKGLDFVRENGLWKVGFDGQVFGFNYLPSEVENVSVDGVYDLGAYVNQPVYFVNGNEAIGEVLNNIGGYFLRYQEACLNGTSCEGDLPTKGCDNNLIIFEEGNRTRVYQNESCVFIVGDSIRGVDAFLYEVLKIN